MRLLFLTPAFLLFINASHSETVTFSVGEWPPYTTIKNEPSNKISENIVKEALALENIKVNLVYHPWQRSYIEAAQGRVDGTFPWVKAKDRANEFIFTKELVGRSEEVFFHLKEFDFKWNTFSDLKKYRIGAINGYHHINILKKNSINPITAYTAYDSFKKLLHNRIDAFPEDIIVGQNIIIKKLGKDALKRFAFNPKKLFIKKLRVLLPKSIKSSERLRKKLDSGIKKLKKSGRFDELINLRGNYSAK